MGTMLWHWDKKCGWTQKWFCPWRDQEAEKQLEADTWRSQSTSYLDPLVKFFCLSPSQPSAEPVKRSPGEGVFRHHCWRPSSNARGSVLIKTPPCRFLFHLKMFMEKMLTACQPQGKNRRWKTSGKEARHTPKVHAVRKAILWMAKPGPLCSQIRSF